MIGLASLASWIYLAFFRGHFWQIREARDDRNPSTNHAPEVVVLIPARDEATCIGCSACAKNCPYDAIRMVEIRDARGDLLLDQNTNKPIAKATKCDLCIDQLGGPACQRAWTRCQVRLSCNWRTA